MRCLIDASVWIASADPTEPGFESSRRLISDPRVELEAIDLTLLEVINATASRSEGGAAGAALKTITKASSGSIHRVGSDLAESVQQLVESNPLTAYDAAYVAAAHRDETHLVSLDMKDLVKPGWAITPEQALAELEA